MQVSGSHAQLRVPATSSLVVIASTFTLIVMAADGFRAFPHESVTMFGVALLALTTFGLLRPSGVGSWAIAVASLLAAQSLWVASEPTRLLAVAVVLGGSMIRGREETQALRRLLAGTLGLTSLWYAAYSALPGFYAWHQEASRWLSSLFARSVGSQAAFGGLALGLAAWVTGLAALITLACERPRRRGAYFVVGCLVLLGTTWLHVVTAGITGEWVVLQFVGTAVPRAYTVVTPLAIVVLLTWGALRSARESSGATAGARAGSAAFVVTGGVLALAALVVGAWPHPDVRDRLDGDLVFYDKGYLSWEVPTFDLFGLNSVGMFGMLPDYVESIGVRSSKVTELTREELADKDIVVFINLLESISSQEHDVLWEFVEGGGAMLVLGDHTGFNAIREPFNELLTPVGIEFQFDSAKPLDSTWRTGIRAFPTRIGKGIRHDTEFGIGVGASLVVPTSARLEASAVVGFADDGDKTEVNRGYLGDYAYNPHEPLGDLPVVASTRFGAGRVLVFGDTSPFQNGSMGQAETFLDNCMRWLLNGDDSVGISRLLMGLGAGGTFLSVLFLLLARRADLAGLTLAILPHATLAPWRAAERVEHELPATWSRALVDLEHGQGLDAQWWNQTSMAGLHLTLLRNRIWPTPDVRAFDQLLDPDVDMLVMYPPAIGVDPEDMRRVRAFVEEGGTLLATIGGDGGRHALAFLDDLGFSIHSQPLGPEESPAFDEAMQFMCAYPIDRSPEGFEVFAQAYGCPVAGIQRVGEGAIVLISDSRFLVNDNLEGKERFVPTNAKFVRALVSNLRKGGLL